MKIGKEFFLNQMLRSRESVTRSTRYCQAFVTDKMLQFCKERHCSLDNIRNDEFLQWLKSQKK